MNSDYKDNFLRDFEVKPKLSSEQVTGEDLKRNLILTFGTFKKASDAAGFSESRLHQIFAGYRIPKNPDLIKKMSVAWNIDLVILTKILSELDSGLIKTKQNESMDSEVVDLPASSNATSGTETISTSTTGESAKLKKTEQASFSSIAKAGGDGDEI